MSKYSCDDGCEEFNIVEEGNKLVVVCADCGERFDDNLFIYI